MAGRVSNLTTDDALLEDDAAPPVQKKGKPFGKKSGKGKKAKGKTKNQQRPMPPAPSRLAKAMGAPGAPC